MNILITGGGGFLGQHVARRAAEQGHQVVVYDLAFPAHIDELAKTHGVVRMQGDIVDSSRLREALREAKPEVFIHLATALTDVCESDPVKGTFVNCVGSATVFDAAIKSPSVRRVLFGSSVAVFSTDPAQPTGDNRPIMPANIYGATKAYMERLASSLMETHTDADLLGLRFGWIYGPGRVRGWREIQRVIKGFALEEPEVLYPDYDAANDWTFIDDAVQVVLACLTSPRASVTAYNVSGDYRTIHEAVAHLRAKFPYVRAKPYAATLPRSAWEFKSDRIIKEVGLYPTTRLEAGLDQTVELIRQ